MERLQVCFFSATLHSPEITRLADQICHNPTWVDLKGDDTVPDTVSLVWPFKAMVIGPYPLLSAQIGQGLIHNTNRATCVVILDLWIWVFEPKVHVVCLP